LSSSSAGSPTWTVRVVSDPAVLEAAEVQDDHVALLDRALAHLVMRVGAVRARADDRDVDL
jgi:hypothetical protein